MPPSLVRGAERVTILVFRSRLDPRLRWLHRALIVALFSCSSTGRAEDAETRTVARDLATQGAQAFDAGRFAEASDFFRRAHELVPAPSIALLRARSLAKVGQLLEAIDIYEQTARFKLAEDAPEAYAQAVETARDEIEGVRHRLPRLKVTVLGLTKGEVAQVSMDDKPTPEALLGVERPVNPGQHHIEARLAGQLRAGRELSLAEGESRQIELDLRQEPAQKSQVLPYAGSASLATGGYFSRKTWGYVGLGVGALGFGIGTYTGLTALHHKSDLDFVCHPACPRSSSADLDGFRTNRTISYLSFGVGIVAAGTGIVLLSLGGPAQEHLAVRAVPMGLQIGGRL